MGTPFRSCELEVELVFCNWSGAGPLRASLQRDGLPGKSHRKNTQRSRRSESATTELGVSGGLLEPPVALLQERYHSCCPGEKSCMGTLPLIHSFMSQLKRRPENGLFCRDLCGGEQELLLRVSQGKESPPIPPHLFSMKASAYPSQLLLPRVCSRLHMGMVPR